MNPEQASELSLSPAFRRYLRMTAGVQRLLAARINQLRGDQSCLKALTTTGQTMVIWVKPDDPRIVCADILRNGKLVHPTTDREYTDICNELERILKQEVDP